MIIHRLLEDPHHGSIRLNLVKIPIPLNRNECDTNTIKSFILKKIYDKKLNENSVIILS